MPISIIRVKITCGGIAQSGEHMHHTHGVAGSSPVASTFQTKKTAHRGLFFKVKGVLTGGGPVI